MNLSIETLTCKWCGGRYEHRKDRTDESRFCSQKCRNEWQVEKRHVFDCKVCGETVKLPPSRDNREFCSSECYGEWESEHESGKNHHMWEGGEVTAECEWCGKRYDVRQNRAEDSRFCSNKCYGDWRSENIVEQNHPDWKGGDVTKECEWCGDEYEARRYRADESRFCGQMCYAAWKSENESGQDSPLWKGGKNVTDAVRKQLHGENWHLISQRLRRGSDCRMCGTTEELQVHHIVPILAGGLNGDWNLMVLCPSCHSQAEWYSRNFVGRVLIPDNAGHK